MTGWKSPRSRWRGLITELSAGRRRELRAMVEDCGTRDDRAALAAREDRGSLSHIARRLGAPRDGRVPGRTRRGDPRPGRHAHGAGLTQTTKLAAGCDLRAGTRICGRGVQSNHAGDRCRGGRSLLRAAGAERYRFCEYVRASHRARSPGRSSALQAAHGRQGAEQRGRGYGSRADPPVRPAPGIFMRKTSTSAGRGWGTSTSSRSCRPLSSRVTTGGCRSRSSTSRRVRKRPRGRASRASTKLWLSHDEVRSRSAGTSHIPSGLTRKALCGVHPCIEKIEEAWNFTLASGT